MNTKINVLVASLFLLLMSTVNISAHELMLNDVAAYANGGKKYKYKKHVRKIVKQLKKGIRKGEYDKSYIISILDYIKEGPKELKELEATYTINDVLDNDVISESGELILPIIPGREIDKLHASTHGLHPLERHALPAYYDLPEMDKVDDFVVTEDEMVVINPAPGEFVRIMEGKRHGYKSTTVGISRTMPGGGAPLHTHESEETHVLLNGKMRYQLGEEVFEAKSPYVINIPPMVPHAFMSLDKKPIELVVFYPVNEWVFDFVEHANAETFFQLPLDQEDDENSDDE